MFIQCGRKLIPKDGKLVHGSSGPYCNITLKSCSSCRSNIQLMWDETPVSAYTINIMAASAELLGADCTQMPACPTCTCKNPPETCLSPAAPLLQSFLAIQAV